MQIINGEIMKVLGICCSPRKGGNTESLVREALKGAQQEGAEVDIFCVSGKHIEPCDGCRSCVKTGKCHIKDDMQELYEKMYNADSIIFASPTYNFSMIAQTKLIIDRSRAMREADFNNLANKVGGIIAVGGSLGLVDVVKELYFHIVTNHMLPGEYVAVYAQDNGDYKKRTDGIEACVNLGRQMACLAAMKFAYPAKFMRPALAYGQYPHVIIPIRDRNKKEII